MKRFYTLLPIYLFLYVSLIYADEGQSVVGKYVSSGLEGKDFLIGFMQNEVEHSDKDASLSLVYCITSPYEGNVVTVTNNYTDESFTINLNRNQTEVFEADDEMENDEPSVRNKKSIRISSKFPILVYCYNYFNLSMDSYAALPIEQWGREYATFSMPLDDYEYSTSPNEFSFIKRKGQVLLISDSDNNTVQITTPVDLDDGRMAGSTSSIILNRNDVYIIEPAAIDKQEGDLTGINIRSTRPLGVLSGHQRSATNFSRRTPAISKDHLVEMLIPKEQWKTKYYTIPFFEGDAAATPSTYYKVLGSESDMIITSSSWGISDEYQINNLTDHVYIKDLEGPVLWESDKPFSVMQIMARNEINMGHRPFDPSFLNAILTNPVSNYLYFYIPRFANGQTNNEVSFFDKIGIVCTKSAVNFLKHNDKLIKDDYSYSPLNAQFMYVVINAVPGINTLATEAGAFSANSYGVNNQISYAHNLTGEQEEEVPYPSEIYTEYTEDCFSFECQVKSKSTVNQLGIKWVDIIASETYNMDYDIEYDAMDTVVYISGSLTNQSIPGKLTLEIVNEYGLGMKWSSSLNGFRINTKSGFDFGEYELGDSTCISDFIKNTNDFPIEIKNIILPNNQRLVVNPSDLLGKEILPGATEYISYCLVGTDISREELLDSVIYDFGCVQRTKTITGTVLVPESRLKGYEFAKTRVADVRCGNITLQNTGNQPNTIYRISWPENSSFTFDTTGRFPITLEPNDIYDLIGVCFHPEAVGDYNFEVTAINSLGIDMRDIVAGSSGEPKFESYEYDFGKIRTGLESEHTFSITNSGSYQGDLIYLESKISGEANMFDEGNVNDNIVESDEGGEVFRSISFKPTATGEFTNEYYFIVDPDYAESWQHDTILITFSGEGIEPEITSYSYDLGEHIVGDKIEIPKLLFDIGGNDSVVIKEINPLNPGDITSEDLNHHTLIAKREDNISGLISYNPTVDGIQSHAIEMVSDAGYGKQEQRDTAFITAMARPMPYLLSNSELEMVDITSCISDEYHVEVSLPENAAIDSLVLIPECSEITIPDNLERFRSDNSYNIPLAVNTKNSSYCESELEIYIHVDTIVSNRLIELDTIMKQPIIVEPYIPFFTNSVRMLPNPDNELSSIGEPVSVEYKITWEHDLPLNNQQNITIDLYYDHTLLDLLENTFSLMVGERVHNVTVKSNEGHMSFELPNNLVIGSGADDIVFTQSYLVLLNGKTSTDMDLSVTISDCFSPQLSTYTLNIDEVCDFHLRTVRFLSNLTNANFEYNALNKYLVISTDSDYPEKANFEVYNSSGQLVHVENFVIPSDKHEKNVNLSNYPSGTYFFRVRFSTDVINGKISLTN